MSTAETTILSSVAQTLLIPLYIRAAESQRPDALIRDDQAVARVQRLGTAPAWFPRMQVDEDNRVAIVLRNRQIDRWTRDFVAKSGQAAVVHIGCGLDSRFERVDNGQVEWYDLDLPEVIALRRKLLGGEGPRYHLLACSALDPSWMEAVRTGSPRRFLFVAEGVLMYLDRAQVKWLVLALQRRFPGAELIADTFSPFMVWANNLRYSRTGIGARCQWGLKRGRDLEAWDDGIKLLDEWYPFSRSEPRLARARWVRHIPFFARVIGVFRYLFNPADRRPGPTPGAN
ncbi:MAG: class I SAM-dependent methyltransferase [Rudaea sp.]